MTKLYVLSKYDKVRNLVDAVVGGYAYDPGDSDLDNEQPIHVSMTLGDYRRARLLSYQLRDNDHD